MDFIVALPASKGNTLVWVVVDKYSKQAYFFPLPSLHSALDLASSFIDNIVSLHGNLTDIVSDRGPQFLSAFLRAICKHLGLKTSLSSGYHPQTDGQTKRVNQDQETYLRAYVNAEQDNWSEMQALAHNSQWHPSLRCSPFQAAYGFQPKFLPF